MKYHDENAGFRGWVAWLYEDDASKYYRWQMVSTTLTLTRNNGSGDVDVATFSGGAFYALTSITTDGQINAFGTSGYSTFGKDVYIAGVLGVNDGGFADAFTVKGKAATDRAKFYATQQMTVDVGASGTGGRTWGWRTGNNASGINGKVRLVDITGAATVLEFDTSGNATFGGTAAPVFAAAPTTSLQGATKGYVDTAVAGVTGVPAVDIQVFTASGTWTKPVVGTPKFVYSRCVGPGSGGGSGRKGAAGTTRTGGSGGGSGGVSDGWWPASALPATVAVTVGTGGVGGASQATNSTNGVNSSLPSGGTTFGDFLVANFGARGLGGANVAQAGGGAGTGLLSPGAAGGTAQTSGTSGAGAESTGYGPGAGGGGGPVSNVNAATSGGNGGDGGGAFYPGALAGGSGSTGAGSNGTDSATNSGIGGSGGGGGGGNHTGAAFAGGNGGYPGGGGGGGGGSTDSVGNSGKGGDGANGFCIVVTYF